MKTTNVTKRAIEAVLLHAYSRRNSGDGLLVDLSAALLREALGEPLRLVVVAADPDSFSDYEDVIGAPVMSDAGSSRYRSAFGFPDSRSKHKHKQLQAAIERADLLVGVGGGYLRAKDYVEGLKLDVGHMRQIRLAAQSGKPTIYLPQSVGPFPNCALSTGVGKRLVNALARFEKVYVRDERSAACLADNANVSRAPDLAVLEFAHVANRTLARADAAGRPVRRVAMVLREAPAWKAQRRDHYDASIRKLIGTLAKHCELTFAVQSTGRGNDDTAYYRRIGVEGDVHTLRDVLSENAPDFVVSVRLHGALESILCGVPAFHLSYERKGFGAYGDLGLTDWVVNAADFDADSVVERIFARDAVAAFWATALSVLRDISAHRQAIVQTLRSAARWTP